MDAEPPNRYALSPMIIAAEPVPPDTNHVCKLGLMAEKYTAVPLVTPIMAHALEEGETRSI
jgi:hypothetical protein